MQNDRRRVWMFPGAAEVPQIGYRLERTHFQQQQSRAWVCWEPSVDMHQRVNGLVIWAALPGVPPEQCEVILEDSMLILRGQRLSTVDLSAGNIFHLEIPYGPFERRVNLPPGVYRVVERQLEFGCLRLHLECVP